MKTTRKKSTMKTCIGITLAAFVAASAQEEVVINFSANYITGEIPRENFVLPEPVDVPDTNKRTWKYSDSTAISPTANYAGPEIFGGFQTEPDDDGSAELFWITGLHNPTYPPLENTKLVASASCGNSTLTALFVFKPAVGAGQTVCFDETSSLDYVVNSTSPTRLVVKNAGTWYISSIPLKLGEEGGSLAGFDLLDSNWAEFDPEDASPLPEIPDSSSGEYSTLGSSFTDIQGVGVYNAGYRAGENAPYVALGKFTLTATGIPKK